MLPATDQTAGGPSGDAARTVALVADSPLGAPAEHGCARLVTALEGRGWRCARGRSLPAAPEVALAFVVAVSPAAGTTSRRLAAQAGVSLPEAAESLAFVPLPPESGRPPAVLVLGADDRGLMYALLEAARRIELQARSPASGGQALLDLFPAAVEAPQRRLRSLCVFPHHEALDREWYRSLDFWRWYFDLLALHRFNRFTLTYGHQTAYLAPPYPFFVAVPEHPEVSVPGLGERARDENLALLRAIARLATERGLDFALGVWSQHAYSYGRSTVDGLDDGNLAAYCAAGLRRMVEAVPDISAVQLRVNAESGVHLDEGARFWRALFDGIAASGRPVTLDLRAKGIVDDTIAAGLATGLPVIVDTKFWTEHHGLPYHATLLQEGDRYVRRHSYGDQLRYPGGGSRLYDFLFQLWNLGTNRFLLWADPEWVRRFARASTLGGAAGFEGCAPLSNKGFGNRGGVWRLFADPSDEHYRWEQERYWYWYVLFGRLGYGDDADPTVWRREWAARIGEAAAPQLERALGAASGVLPLLTACHSPSASVFGYWPEKDMGGLLDLYLQVQGSDTGMFASAQEAVADRLRGTPGARQTPAQSSAVFTALAGEAAAALDKARAGATPEGDSAARELKSVALDVRIQALLAQYHAAKLQAAEHLAAFYAAGDIDSLLAARPLASAALDAWERLVALTDGVYHHDLIFGRPGDQDGHWKDNLPYARHDVARLDEVQDVFDRYGLFDFGFDFGGQLPPRTGTPPMPYLHDYAVERRFAGVGPQTLYTPETGFGWGGTYGLVATEAPAIDGKTLRAAAPNPTLLPREALYCDFVGRHPAAPYNNATFLVDVPDGAYEVVTILADRSANPKDHGPMVVRLQGRHEPGPMHVPAGEIVELRRRVDVTAGRVDVEVSAPPQGDWLLTGLVVTRVAPHLGHLPPACARPGEPLDLRATVTSPEPLRTVAARYRFAGHGAFDEVALLPVPPPPPTPTDAMPPLAAPTAASTDTAGAATPLPAVRFAASLTVPSPAPFVEYFLEAADARGTIATWPPAGAAMPRRVYAGAAATPPAIEHRAVAGATPGEPIEIRACVSSSAPLARVTIHYRNLNQMQTHDRLAMERVPERVPVVGLDSESVDAGLERATYSATIPGAHVSPEWDVMYHLEAVDVLGNAAFYPGLGADTPYIVVPVRRAAAVPHHAPTTVGGPRVA